MQKSGFKPRFEGRYITSSISIATVVRPKLKGYADIMVANVWECLKTVFTHIILKPQTPTMETIAGATDIPQPLK